jgi:hypothetical protein
MHEKPEPTLLGRVAHSSTTQPAIHTAKKSKRNSQHLLRLRRIRLELPPGASRKPAGSPARWFACSPQLRSTTGGSVGHGHADSRFLSFSIYKPCFSNTHALPVSSVHCALLSFKIHLLSAAFCLRSQGHSTRSSTHGPRPTAHRPRPRRPPAPPPLPPPRMSVVRSIWHLGGEPAHPGSGLHLHPFGRGARWRLAATDSTCLPRLQHGARRRLHGAGWPAPTPRSGPVGYN